MERVGTVAAFASSDSFFGRSKYIVAPNTLVCIGKARRVVEFRVSKDYGIRWRNVVVMAIVAGAGTVAATIEW